MWDRGIKKNMSWPTNRFLSCTLEAFYILNYKNVGVKNGGTQRTDVSSDRTDGTVRIAGDNYLTGRISGRPQIKWRENRPMTWKDENKKKEHEITYLEEKK
jgi:hypothetical protein